MAGRSSPSKAKPKAGWRIALVRSRFHEDITEAMLADARRRVGELGGKVVHEAETTGAYDLPLIVQKLAGRKDVDAVVAIGCIVTGGTEHDEAIAHALFYALTQVSMGSGKPIGLGVTGPGQTLDQAKARIDRAGAAVDAVAAQLVALAALAKT